MNQNFSSEKASFLSKHQNMKQNFTNYFINIYFPNLIYSKIANESRLNGNVSWKHEFSMSTEGGL